MSNGRAPLAFLSYVRADDEYEGGRITALREQLSGEIRMQTGREFPIFQDRNDLRWGQNWRKRIEESLDGVTFLIPVITPSFFASEWCRKELERFLERERRLGRSDLVLPVYYVDYDALNDERLREEDPLAQAIYKHTWEDWRELRFEPWTSTEIRKRFAKMARQINDAIKRSLAASPQPKPSPSALDKTEDLLAPSAPTDRAESVWTRIKEKDERHLIRKSEPPIRVVDQLNRGDHPTIIDALAAAAPGDRILVRPGLYRETLVIDKPIELLGEGNLQDIVLEVAGADVIQFQASIGRIANLTIRQSSGNFCGLNIAQGRLSLEDCAITGAGLAGLAIHSGADPWVRKNRICSCRGAGIIVYAQGRGTIEDNEICENALAGVEIRDGSDPTLYRNRIHDCRGPGILTHGHTSGKMEDNDIFGNSQAGVEIRGGANPTLRRNRIRNGKRVGVNVIEGGRGMLEDNEIAGNEHAGIVIVSGGDPIIRGNQICSNRQAGIFVGSQGKTTIEENDILDNKEAGVAIVGDSRAVVRRNRINRNRREAIWIDDNGGGTFEDNDLRGNRKGSWGISQNSLPNVTRTGNVE